MPRTVRIDMPGVLDHVIVTCEKGIGYIFCGCIDPPGVMPTEAKKRLGAGQGPARWPRINHETLL